MHRRCHDRRWRVGAHAAGVGSFIVVEDTLVILRRCQRQNMLAVGQHHERSFFAVQKFFDHKFVAGLTEGLAHENLIDGGFGFREALANDHAFAAGETVGFDDVGRFLLGEILLWRTLRR